MKSMKRGLILRIVSSGEMGPSTFTDSACERKMIFNHFVLNYFVRKIFFDRIYKMDRINYELKKHCIEEKNSHAEPHPSERLVAGREEH